MLTYLISILKIFSRKKLLAKGKAAYTRPINHLQNSLKAANSTTSTLKTTGKLNPLNTVKSTSEISDVLVNKNKLSFDRFNTNNYNDFQLNEDTRNLGL